MVHHASHEADNVVNEGIDHKSSDIFRLANQRRKENVDAVGDKPVKNDAGEISLSEEAKQNAWAEHYDYTCAWEMPAILTADHKVKFRSDLISWRW